MSLDLLLPIPEPAQLWQQTQPYVIDRDRWTAYLNQLSLNAILPLLREDFPQAKQASHLNIWAFVNGTALTANGVRLLIIPTEAIDQDEFRIPQEWIDLPSWAADYYLAVQVEPDQAWVKIWGYATHHTIKTAGQLDFSDRTYSLDHDLLKDFSLLWLSRELCPQEPIRSDIANVDRIALEQANHLIDRLGNSSVISPRLTVPFQWWGALMEHGGWRQKLYQHRQGIQSQDSVVQWLRTGVSNVLGWQCLEMQPSTIGARGTETQTPIQILSRPVAIAGQTYELRVIPQAEHTWRFELRNTTPGGLIPGGFKLRLLTEDLQPFAGNEAIAETATEALWIEVMLDAGEGLVWETEPIAEECDANGICFAAHEILRF